ncbi:MAG: hypothetical protein WDN46_16060 [Methylocella sp.]
MRITTFLSLLFLPALLVGEAQADDLLAKTAAICRTHILFRSPNGSAAFDPEWQHCQAILAAEAQGQAARAEAARAARDAEDFAATKAVADQFAR